MRNTVDLIENELINFFFDGLVWIHSDDFGPQQLCRET